MESKSREPGPEVAVVKNNVGKADKVQAKSKVPKLQTVRHRRQADKEHKLVHKGNKDKELGLNIQVN